MINFMLNNEEKYRYNRHLILDSFGEEGQLKLKKTSVLIVGAGGLGCPCLLYLTAAGVGNIGIIDFDVVDESNLQRQILFDINDIGKNKAIQAKIKLEKQNPYINITAFDQKLTPKNAVSLFEKYDIIIDGTDNFSTRYLVNDCCVLLNKPFVYGAIFKFDGQVSVFNYKNGPTYRCLFPTAPDQNNYPTCSSVGVLGVLSGVIGTLQATEAVKIALNHPNVLNGKILLYNALNTKFKNIFIERNNEAVELLKSELSNFESRNYEYNCEFNTKESITSAELKEKLTLEVLQILDVREPYEEPKINELNAINIPLNQLPANLNRLDKNKTTVVFCQHGIRSQMAIDFLEEAGFEKLINLKNGIITWI